MSYCVTLHHLQETPLVPFADSSSQPNIRFPKSLLNVPGIMNFTSVKAYLTVPQLKSELESFPSTVGVMDSKSSKCFFFG